MINKTAVVISSGFEKSGIGKYSQNLYELIEKEFRTAVKVFLNCKKSRVEIYKKEKIEHISLIKIPFEPAYLFQWRCRNLLNGLGDIYFITNEKNALINVKPKVVTCHDLIIFKHPSKIWQIFARKYMYSHVKKADFILCSSESTRKDLENILKVDPERTALLYPTISGDYHKKNKEDCNFLIKKYNLSDSKKILFVGSEEPRKNMPVLLEIFKRILDKRKDVELIKIGSAGSFGSRKKTLQLIKKFDLKEKVKILEEIPEMEMPYFYSLADVLVFPSKYEGFGYPVVEAMSCGCPVVASDNSSLPEILGNAGIKLNCMNIDGFIEKTLEILNDNKLADKMCMMGVKHAEKIQSKEPLNHVFGKINDIIKK
jgi:glycosyltransferase involved in cell wall biosynthesis